MFIDDFKSTSRLIMQRPRASGSINTRAKKGLTVDTRISRSDAAYTAARVLALSGVW
jgi:hypothetical protein